METQNNKKSKSSVLEQLAKKETSGKGLNNKDLDIEHISASAQKDIKRIDKDKINYFSKYFKPILFLIVVIIFAVTYFLFVSPLISQYQTLSTSVMAEKEENLQQQQIIYNELHQLNEKYEEISPYLKDKILNLLPDQPELADLYYNLDQLVQQANYKLLSIDIQAPEEKEVSKAADAYNQEMLMQTEQEMTAGEMAVSQPAAPTKTLKEIKITLSLEGSGYLNFKNFLNIIEHNLRIIDIESFNYNSEQETIDLSLKTYSYQ